MNTLHKKKIMKKYMQHKLCCGYAADLLWIFPVFKRQVKIDKNLDFEYTDLFLH